MDDVRLVEGEGGRKADADTHSSFVKSLGCIADSCLC